MTSKAEEVARKPRVPLTIVMAIVAVVFAMAWMALNVAGVYGGHWNGLFYTGSEMPLPAELAAHTQPVNDPVGYDAAYYHLVAHDPLLRRGFLAYADNARLRWRRIGIPGLAALLALDSDRYVDTAYIAIQLAFVFLGTFWLSRYAELQGRSVVFGLAFLLIPAVLVSLDRMTIDLPLAALAIGIALYAASPVNTGGRNWAPYLMLAAAPLVRETGMVLILAWCVHWGLRRDWIAAGLGAGCAAPALAWWQYVQSHTPPDATAWLASYPFAGIIERTLNGIDHPTSTAWLQLAAMLEHVAIAGIWLAFALTAYLAWRRRLGLVEWTAILFTAFASLLGRWDIWASAYATGRTMSPLLIMLGLLALAGRGWVYIVPLALILPRIALQYQAQWKLALGGLF